VDGGDYVVWRKTVINGQQGYLDWRANFGQFSASGASSIVAVPEPHSLILAALLVATIIFLYRRRL